MIVKNGSKYRIDEKVDGKNRIVGPMKTGGWPGFSTDDKGFLYLNEKFFMSDKPEKDLREEVV